VKGTRQKSQPFRLRQTNPLRSGPRRPFSEEQDDLSQKISLPFIFLQFGESVMAGDNGFKSVAVDGLEALNLVCSLAVT
jgi:hypothetical protein